MRERNRFLRGMVPWVGYKQTGVFYERAARYAGVSKFDSVRRMLPFAVDAITSFSKFPLQMATYFGFFLAFSRSGCHHRRHRRAPVYGW